jgi:TonB family protein
MKNFLTFVVLSFVLGLPIAAQTNNAPKVINGGIINGKAKSLTKPVYPAAAQAVNAEGAVNVQVTVDEAGNISAANAVSGHPLLRQAAVDAALQSKFAPTSLSGQPVKVSGTIVYNFVAGGANQSWFRVGQQLSNLERAWTLQYFNSAQFGKLFQPDWTTENQQLQRLEELKQAEFSADPNSGRVEEVVVEKIIVKPDGTRETTKTTESRIKKGKLNPEQIDAVQSLISSLQNRLGADETDLWDFNLGINIGRALATTPGVAYRGGVQPAAATALRQNIQSAPLGTSPELIAELEKLVQILERLPRSTEDRDEISVILNSINRLQSGRK